MLNLRDISDIVIGHISPQDQYFANLLHLMVRLGYYQHADQMIAKDTLLRRSEQEGHLAYVKYLHGKGAEYVGKACDYTIATAKFSLKWCY